MCYVNAHVDDVNTAIDMPAHWLLDVVAADQGHEFFAGVRYLVPGLCCCLNESVCVLIPVYCVRAIGVMPRTQVDDKAIFFADFAQSMAEENMVFMYWVVLAIAFIYA